MLSSGSQVKVLSKPSCGTWQRVCESRGRIRLLGYRSDVLDLYQAMDVFVLSSIREGLPNVLLEAMASGVPVLTTRVAGVPSLIGDDQTGIAVEPGSIDGLYEGLLRLARDPALRSRLAGAGRRIVGERYSFARRMSAVQRIYGELLGRGSDSG